jgi:peptide/nickel transport system permease protein
VSNYLIRRASLAVPALWGVATIVFFAVRLIPGDPARVMAGDLATFDQVERIRHNLGFDQSVLVQYGQFLLHLAQGDLGRSTATGDSVIASILLRLPYTVELALLATIVGATVGVTLGILAAMRHKTAWDVLISVFSVSGMSMPTYWLGLMLIILFAVDLRWLPASGATEPQAVILPAATLSTLSIALVARMSRSAMLEVLSEDYLRTATAKGLARRTVVIQHALRNALLPVITAIGLQFGSLLGGAVLTESVFSWPGMGRLLVDSIFARDYPVIQGCVLIFSAGFILINIAVEVLYSIADPRIRH